MNTIFPFLQCPLKSLLKALSLFPLSSLFLFLSLTYSLSSLHRSAHSMSPNPATQLQKSVTRHILIGFFCIFIMNVIGMYVCACMCAWVCILTTLTVPPLLSVLFETCWVVYTLAEGSVFQLPLVCLWHYHLSVGDLMQVLSRKPGKVLWCATHS